MKRPYTRMLAAVCASALAFVPPWASAQTATIEAPPDQIQTLTLRGPYTIQYAEGMMVITFGDMRPGPKPPPVPPPGPGPTPDPPKPPPAPVATGRLWVTLIYDSAAETQEQATTRADLATAPEWAGLDVIFSAYEQSQAVVDDLKLRSHVGKTPCVVIQERKTSETSAPVIMKMDAVASKDAVLNAVKTLRGDR